MKKSSFYLLLIKTSGYLLVPLVLLVLPADFFDSGQSLCLSQLLADMACLGCGMTRAMMHLIHLDLAAAASFNKGSFMVLPVLSVLWAQGFFKDLKRLQEHLRPPLA